MTFTYGSEKEGWIQETTAAFNGENHRLASGKTIRVTATAMGSGECRDEIIAGTRQTDLTSPASSAYVDLGNAQWRARSGHDLLARTENLVLSPVVIGIWKPMAEALGWGQKPVGWAEVLALARDHGAGPVWDTRNGASSNSATRTPTNPTQPHSREQRRAAE